MKEVSAKERSIRELQDTVTIETNDGFMIYSMLNPFMLL
jgi:hypothetical protein